MATNTYVALDKVTVSGTSTATISFSSIPSGYTDLVIVGNLGSETTNAFPYLQFNGDVGSNYSYTQVYGNGSTTASSKVTNNTQLFNSDVSVKQGAINANVIYNIMNYTNTTTFKTAFSRQNTVDAADYNGSLLATGLWRSTTAITSIQIKLTRGGTPYNFSNGTTFSLYGISSIGDVTPKATGGIVTSDSTYWYHTFEMSGNFVPNQSLTCDYLVVAGGGGGGTEYGGGGGAGGYRTSIGGSALSLTAQNYLVTVGGGGAGGSAAGTNGTNGNNSIFSTITSVGGGGGGANLSQSVPPNGSAGGSGGGGGITNYGSGTVTASGGAGTAGQGNAGGIGGRLGGGGGGGAGAVGANYTTSPGTGQIADNKGNGGVGLISTLTGTSTYYAGGGGGIGWSGTTIGGLGGGGNGAYVTGTPATVGAQNTGGGGGGGAGFGSLNGAQGGSGIVIVRYAK